MYMSMGAGGVVGCIFGGLMTNYYHPKWCFFSYSWVGLIVTGFAFFLTKESERDRVSADEGGTDSDISTSQEAYEAE